MEVSTIIIDNGAYTLRAGMSGLPEPTVYLPTVLGRTNIPRVQGDIFAPKDLYIGSDVFTCDIQNLEISRPIKDRKITNYNDIEKLWDQIFVEELKVKPEEHPVILTEAPQTTNTDREKSIQIMMETYHSAAYYSALTDVLTLYSAGLTTGLVIDSGETITDILPIFECYPMMHVFSRLPIGGSHINGYLKRLLIQSGIEVPDKRESLILQDIKEKLCYVPIDIEEEQHKYEHVNDEIGKTYQMPDGGPEVHIVDQRFRCVEPLFDPRLIQVQSEGITQLLYSTINKCADLKQEMFRNIVLSGGSSQFPGLGKRLERDLSKLAPNMIYSNLNNNNVKDGSTTNANVINVIANANRNNAAWVGGSVLASQSAFSLMWVTKEDYQEVGPQIVNLKCF